LPPKEQEPVSGFVPPTLHGNAVAEPGSLTLVRNPSWDPATDDLRAALPDRMEIALGGDARDLATDVEEDKLDMVYGVSATAEQVDRLQADPATADRVFLDPNDTVLSITMDVAMPPFDDVHVRRAVSFAVNKAELLRLLARPPYDPAIGSTGIVATHLAPDAQEANLLLGFDPYPHDLARARAEMRRSAYDRDGDGRCDAPACRGVLTLVSRQLPFPSQGRSIRRDLAAIGIDLDLVSGSFFHRLNDPAQRIPIGIGSGWGKDYPNASTWFPDQFASQQIEAGSNVSHVGASPEQLRAWGYPVTAVPNVDDRIARCQALLGSAQTECWAELDQYLMNEVVPLVPYLTLAQAQIVSERVVAYSFDQFAAEPALDRIALAPGSA
jgi:peptide/nickel transport system substrate-binding protein